MGVLQHPKGGNPQERRGWFDEIFGGTVAVRKYWRKNSYEAGDKQNRDRARRKVIDSMNGVRRRASLQTTNRAHPYSLSQALGPRLSRSLGSGVWVSFWTVVVAHNPPQEQPYSAIQCSGAKHIPNTNGAHERRWDAEWVCSNRDP